MAAIVTFYEQEPAKYRGDGKAPYVEQYPLNRAKQFELEHPEPGLAYVRHPKRSRRLLPLATYHPSILAEKTTEAINMLTWLGASQIDVSYSSKISDQAKADLEIFFGLLKVKGEKGSEETNRFIYRARGVGAPPRELPDLVWTEEPGWRGVIEGRMHGGLHEFDLAVTYDHQAGVTGDLATLAKRFSLGVGGEFRRSHKVTFSVSGRFPELPPPVRAGG